MKINLKLLIPCVATLFMFSCSHTAGEDDPISNLGDLKYNSTQEMFAANAPSPEEFSVTAENGGFLTTKNGYEIYFYPNSFELNGNPVTGSVDVEFLEVSTPMDMILTGANTTASPYALQSDGMFKITVSQNGNELDLKNGQSYNVTIPASQTDFAMKIFSGEVTGSGIDGNIVRWTEEKESGWTAEDSNQTRGNYYAQLKFLSWCNLDKWMQEGEQTKVILKVPEGYDNSNTEAFMIFRKDQVTCLFGDPDEKAFSTGSHYTCQVGLDVKFLVISVKDKKVAYAIADSKIVKDHVETINSLTEITEDELKTILAGL